MGPRAGQGRVSAWRVVEVDDRHRGQHSEGGPPGRILKGGSASDGGEAREKVWEAWGMEDEAQGMSCNGYEGGGV